MSYVGVDLSPTRRRVADPFPGGPMATPSPTRSVPGVAEPWFRKHEGPAPGRARERLVWADHERVGHGRPLAHLAAGMLR